MKSTKIFKNSWINFVFRRLVFCLLLILLVLNIFVLIHVINLYVPRTTTSTSIRYLTPVKNFQAYFPDQWYLPGEWYLSSGKWYLHMDLDISVEVLIYAKTSENIIISYAYGTIYFTENVLEVLSFTITCKNECIIVFHGQFRTHLEIAKQDWILTNNFLQLKDIYLYEMGWQL